MDVIFFNVVWINTKFARFFLYFLPMDHSFVLFLKPIQLTTHNQLFFLGQGAASDGAVFNKELAGKLFERNFREMKDNTFCGLYWPSDPRPHRGLVCANLPPSLLNLPGSDSVFGGI
jgi:hypothetical protein